MAKRDTRTELLDEAEAVVRSRGHDGFSYADLSDAIGIKKASIHYHFPSKADLLRSVMERYHDNIRASLEAIDANENTSADRLAAFLDIYRTALNNCTALCLCVAFSIGQDGLSQETKTEISGFRDMILSWLMSTFELARSDQTVKDLGGVEEEALSLFALAEGAQITARFNGSVERFDAATSRFRQRLLQN